MENRTRHGASATGRKAWLEDMFTRPASPTRCLFHFVSFAFIASDRPTRSRLHVAT